MNFYKVFLFLVFTILNTHFCKEILIYFKFPVNLWHHMSNLS